MRILESDLRPHLERVTKDFEANKDKWLSDFKTIASEDSNFRAVENAERLKLERQSAAEKYREQGNTSLKAGKVYQAQFKYSQSIAAAIEGPLASMAYFNRYAHPNYYQDM
jgi:hypothetical protein